MNVKGSLAVTYPGRPPAQPVRKTEAVRTSMDERRSLKEEGSLVPFGNCDSKCPAEELNFTENYRIKENVGNKTPKIPGPVLWSQ